MITFGRYSQEEKNGKSGLGVDGICDQGQCLKIANLLRRRGFCAQSQRMAKRPLKRKEGQLANEKRFPYGPLRNICILAAPIKDLNEWTKYEIDPQDLHIG